MNIPKLNIFQKIVALCGGLFIIWLAFGGMDVLFPAPVVIMNLFYDAYYASSSRHIFPFIQIVIAIGLLVYLTGPISNFLSKNARARHILRRILVMAAIIAVATVLIMIIGRQMEKAHTKKAKEIEEKLRTERLKNTP